jgi:SAM-dependent methyltransferase
MAGVSSDFDLIADVYDATREPLGAEVVAAVGRTLKEWGVRQVLEVGVGTGRVASPLQAEGLELTGLDASAGMLARAREKGLRRLVRGSAYRLPFADRSFDSALFVHVLHLLEEPERALREALRVSRGGAAALLRPRSGRDGAGDRAEGPRAQVLQRLRSEGIRIPERAAAGPLELERRWLTVHPPQRQVVLSDTEVTEPLAHELRIYAVGASRWTLRVPKGVLARAVEEVRAEIGDRVRTYRRVFTLALWTMPPETGPTAVPSSPGPRG